MWSPPLPAMRVDWWAGAAGESGCVLLFSVWCNVFCDVPCLLPLGGQARGRTGPWLGRGGAGRVAVGWVGALTGVRAGGADQPGVGHRRRGGAVRDNWHTARGVMQKPLRGAIV